MSRRRVLRGLLLVFGVTSVAWFSVWCFPLINANRIRAWVAAQELPVGEHGRVELPWHLAIGTARGEASVLVRADGSYLALVKTSIGWKQNYRGFLLSERAIGSGMYYKDYYGRKCVEFGKLEYPVVEQVVDEKTLWVFFDLG